MTIVLAKKTMAAIDAAIEADQGGAYRQNLQRVLPHMGDAFRGQEDGFRSHLGASVIGKSCGRAIWYGFRWAHKPRFPGRMLRLFNRGHLEEARLIAALLTVGCQVYQQDENGNQFRISDHGGHFGGSGDGVVMGLPDLPPNTPAITEWKTHNDKSFKAVTANGVREAKFEHFVQMQIYMRKMGIMFALYGAVNKNDDHIHLEIVQLDPTFADQFVDRGRTLIMMRNAPEKIPNASASWYKCRWCDYNPVCHQNEPTEYNCRTCAYSEADVEKGGWWCTNRDRHIAMVFGPKEGISVAGETHELSKERQASACIMYEQFK